MTRSLDRRARLAALAGTNRRIILPGQPTDMGYLDKLLAIITWKVDRGGRFIHFWAHMPGLRSPVEFYRSTRLGQQFGPEDEVGELPLIDLLAEIDPERRWLLEFPSTTELRFLIDDDSPGFNEFTAQMVVTLAAKLFTDAVLAEHGDRIVVVMPANHYLVPVFWRLDGSTIQANFVGGLLPIAPRDSLERLWLPKGSNLTAAHYLTLREGRPEGFEMGSVSVALGAAIDSAPAAVGEICRTIEHRFGWWVGPDTVRRISTVPIGVNT